MKKITYIIADVNKVVFFEHTALGLRSKGFEVSFILINCSNTHLATFLTNEKFAVHHLQVTRIVVSLMQIIKCATLLRNIKPDVIHCHLAIANWVGLWAGVIARVPMRIFTRHSGLPLQHSIKETVIDKIQNGLATHIIAISQNIKRLLINQGVSEHKLIVVHHGFDIERMITPNNAEVDQLKQTYNKSSQVPVIGVIARWMEWKGIQYIIPAFQQLLIEYPNAKLCLFNANLNGDYATELTRLLNTLPQKNYEIVAFENNVYDLYQLFDVYVHTPVNEACEAFGQTYVEALASGIPSVFTLSGIACEFITDEKNALIVPFKNSEEIYKAIKSLLVNNELKQRIIAQGRLDVARSFSLQQYINTLTLFYNA
jgi:glycosyltransferase involved in cell wall biosynthesis